MTEEKPKKTASKKVLKKVTFIENVKHNKSRYKKGDSVEVSQDEYDKLLNADLIQKDD